MMSSLPTMRLALFLFLLQTLLNRSTHAWRTAAATRRRSFLAMAYVNDDGPPSAVSPPPKKQDKQGTLGDIMSDGLVTCEPESLSARFGITKPLDRMAATANGNLQRLVSSYYDAPVKVVVVRSQESSSESASVWDRQVNITVYNQIFCTATSTVTIHDARCQSLVESDQVGLGQLFRHLDRLPTFELMDAGYNDDGALWRLYELKCKELSCRIREVFAPNAWNIKQEDE